jgi:pimeloyl-ACP methyl ester carboxylesterase
LHTQGLEAARDIGDDVIDHRVWPFARAIDGPLGDHIRKSVQFDERVQQRNDEWIDVVRGIVGGLDRVPNRVALSFEELGMRTQRRFDAPEELDDVARALRLGLRVPGQRGAKTPVLRAGALRSVEQLCQFRGLHVDGHEHAAYGGAVVRGMDRVAYDEFSLFHENAEEFGLPFDEPPKVRRTSVSVGAERQLSALVWGTDEPEIVLLHGGAQNAHTWDTVALALGRPLVAIDLPGHGHSDGPREGSSPYTGNAEDVTIAVRELAPAAKAVVGMSAGGLATLALSMVSPELVRAMVLVDILPNPEPTMAKRISDFVDGPETFQSFDDILARTVAFNPTRSVSSLRRGILHNAVQLEDGSWQWRHRRHRRPSQRPTAEVMAEQIGALWTAFDALTVPLMLVRGMADGSVVTDEQEAELLRRVPTARVEHVAGAGHSVQGDKPIELARLLNDFVA